MDDQLTRGEVARYADTLTRPVIARLSENLFVAQFYVMKIVPAKHIIESALRDGSLTREGTAVDTTSGTFGLGMGIVCTELGLRFRVFSDPVIDEALKRRLDMLGGDVVIVEDRSGRSPQQARLEALHAFLESDRNAYWLRQYDNPQVLQAYGPVADDIRSVCRRPIKLVATVGSGGSSCGIAGRLRALDPATELIGVDTFGSVLFGLENASRNLRGMGNSILPGNLDHRAFDEVHWIDGELATRGARRLLARTGLFAGLSTGAAYLVANQVAEETPASDVVFIAPDAGYRYQDRLLRPGPSDVTERALPIRRLSEARGPWARMAWQRRSLRQVGSA